MFKQNILMRWLDKLEIIVSINKYSQISRAFPQFLLSVSFFVVLPLTTTSLLYISTADSVPLSCQAFYMPHNASHVIITSWESC